MDYYGYSDGGSYYGGLGVSFDPYVGTPPYNPDTSTESSYSWWQDLGSTINDVLGVFGTEAVRDRYQGTPPTSTPPAPTASGGFGGMDTKTMLLLGAGVLVVIAVVK